MKFSAMFSTYNYVYTVLCVIIQQQLLYMSDDVHVMYN